jgi:hypothetical protein
MVKLVKMLETERESVVPDGGFYTRAGPELFAIMMPAQVPVVSRRRDAVVWPSVPPRLKA